MSNPNPALNVLDGMAAVVANEDYDIARGAYYHESVCGGKRACAIGSLFIGAGIDQRSTEWSNAQRYSSARPGEFASDVLDAVRPGLAGALNALNTVALDYLAQFPAEKAALAVREWNNRPIEAAFEGGEVEPMSRAKLAQTIKRARRLVAQEA